jgi:hypothetical protein
LLEKFSNIDNPEGFLKSKIAFDQKKELSFLLDARVQQIIRKLLEEIKNENKRKEVEQEKEENTSQEESSFYKYYQWELIQVPKTTTRTALNTNGYTPGGWRSGLSLKKARKT